MNTNISEVRRVLLKVFIGFLSLTAMVAVISLLSHQFGQTEIKVLVTTFAISAGSICAMSCAAFLERNGPRAMGMTGILTAGITVGLVVNGVWSKITQDTYWKTAFTVGVVAVGIAHGCLLRLPKLAPHHRWIQNASSILVTLLAGQVIVPVWGHIDDQGYYRWMAAVSVVLVLLTLVIPICHRLGAEAKNDSSSNSRENEQTSTQLPARLDLQQVAGTLFADATGRSYQVTAINTESEPRLLATAHRLLSHRSTGRKTWN